MPDFWIVRVNLCNSCQPIKCSIARQLDFCHSYGVQRLKNLNNLFSSLRYCQFKRSRDVRFSATLDMTL